jgi:chromosome segregation ATPase
MDTEDEIKKLETRLEELKAAQIAELQERLREARTAVRDLEQQIEKLSGPVSPKRKRISSAEVRDRIHSALKGAKGGLSQKEISEESGVNYQTTALFLRNNAKDFRTTGKFKSKRYFLK